MGLHTQVEVVSFEYVPATAAVAVQLEIETGAEVQRVVRIRSHAGRPFSHLTTHVPAEIGRAYTADDMRETPLLLLLERAQVQIVSGEQTITARLAEPEVARLFEDRARRSTSRDHAACARHPGGAAWNSWKATIARTPMNTGWTSNAPI